jgi:hypothetical protein
MKQGISSSVSSFLSINQHNNPSDIMENAKFLFCVSACFYVVWNQIFNPSFLNFSYTLTTFHMCVTSVILTCVSVHTGTTISVADACLGSASRHLALS